MTVALSKGGIVLMASTLWWVAVQYVTMPSNGQAQLCQLPKVLRGSVAGIKVHLTFSMTVALTKAGITLLNSIGSSAVQSSPDSL